MNNSTRFTPQHNEVLTAIRQRNLLADGELSLVAVSGGQDSLCLLKILVDCGRWPLAVMHLDHGWHPASGEAGVLVAKLCAQWQVPFYLETATVAVTTEAQARTWRYQQLSDKAQQLQARAVLTGHTASDRAETLLLNLLRGAGLSGVGSLDWQRPLGEGVRLVRPLLAITREQTGQFCREQQLPLFIDPSNADLSYTRNRLRLELLPYLAQHFQPQAARVLAQTAEIAAAEDGYLEEIARAWLTEHGDRARLPLAPLQVLPVALQRRVLRQFLKAQGLGVNFQQVEEVRALQPGGRTSSLQGNQGVVARRGWLWWE
jgi:tRNA(Ile)-lysidine synthase